MDIAALERKLHELRERESALSEGLGHGLSPEDRAALWSLYEEIPRVESALAAARGEPHAVEWPWPVHWTFSIEPSPLVIADGFKALAIFEEVKSKPEARRMGVLTFEHCVSTKMGHPNDEVIHGHPLFGKGIRMGGAYLVKHSPWLEEVRAINSVHPQYDPEYWRALNHYLLFFKDRTFECLARSVSSQILEGSMRGVSTQMLNSLLRFP